MFSFRLFLYFLFQFSFDAILMTGLTSTLSLPFNGTGFIQIRKEKRNPIFSEEVEEEKKTDMIKNPTERDRYYLLSAFSCMVFFLVNGDPMCICTMSGDLVNELWWVGVVAHKCRLFQYSISISISRTNQPTSPTNGKRANLSVWDIRSGDIWLDICIYSGSHAIYSGFVIQSAREPQYCYVNFHIFRPLCYFMCLRFVHHQWWNIAAHM